MRAVKAVGFLGALAALMLAGCGDGSIKSPDFESATTLESIVVQPAVVGQPNRSEEHTSELQSLMRNSYAVFCLNKTMKQAEHIYTPCTAVQLDSRTLDIKEKN